MTKTLQLFVYSIRYLVIVVLTLAFFVLVGMISFWLLPASAIATLFAGLYLRARPTKLGPVMALPFVSSAAAQGVLSYANLAAKHGLPFIPWLGFVAQAIIL